MEDGFAQDEQLRAQGLRQLYLGLGGLGFKGLGLRTPKMWGVVKIMVPLWISMIIRHLIFRVSKKGP